MLFAYAATLVLSALLLFLVQPMFAKMVLPSLGGTPAVWNTCMVFFQAALLAGYGYAHLGARWLAPRRQALLHVVLLALSLLTLPVWPRYVDPGDAPPALWLIGLLAVSLGTPFIMLSASAPMLQRWFAGSGHARARDPYFLYSASNVGSLAALLGYPLLAEPLLTLRQQSFAWGAGYGVLVLAIAGCAWLQWRSARGAIATAAGNAAEPAAARRPLTVPRRLRWLLLAFVPSSLMLGVTTHATTDVAAIPLLWVLPLALYLLTFVITFAQRPVLAHGWMLNLQLVVLVAALVPFLWQARSLWLLLPLHLTLFFVSAMVCHGELARDRPATRHLTEFYLWMALGGVLGGMFNALLAPVLFDAILEYPIAIALACLVRPGVLRRRGWAVAAAPLVAAGLVLLSLEARQVGDARLVAGMALSAVAGAGLLVLGCRRRPVALALAVLVLFAGSLMAGSARRLIAAERSFFGVHRVVWSEDGHYRLLQHGTTVHGAQAADSGAARQPLTYYHRDGPLGRIFEALDQRLAGRRIGAVGLGTGAVACYGRNGQQFTFFEIDPVVVDLARSSEYFSYLAACGEVRPDVVLGDARLTLAREPDGAFGMLILDAFSSDSIPLHLLTREAVQLYLTKLAPGGVIAFHISNRYLDLAPALAAVVEDLGGVARVSPRPESERRAERRALMQFDATWVAIARTEGDLGRLATDWARPAAGEAAVWTDDYSNLLSALRRGGSKRAE